jgi:hypothetical protein|tara:strand:+ start:194 stop:727 length:534 start_codon:yes stop_codon:yes gene_type:complete
MNFDIFPTKIYVGNIDAQQIKIKEDKISNKWNNVATSHPTNNLDNTLEKESLDYLFKTITTLLDEVIHKPYRIKLINIWKNYYKNKDFQETHIHPKSNFSFIIYEKIKESQTIFYAPNHFLIQSIFDESTLYTQTFKPNLTKNQIIIFPSFLEHSVEQHNNSISIAGNFNFAYIKGS